MFTVLREETLLNERVQKLELQMSISILRNNLPFSLADDLVEFLKLIYIMVCTICLPSTGIVIVCSSNSVLNYKKNVMWGEPKYTALIYNVTSKKSRE